MLNEDVQYDDPLPPPDSPTQLPDPLVDLIDALELHIQNLRWSPEDPRILFLYLA